MIEELVKQRNDAESVCVENVIYIYMVALLTAVNTVLLILNSNLVFTLGYGSQFITFLFSDNVFWTILPAISLVIGYLISARLVNKDKPAGYLIAFLIMVIDTIIAIFLLSQIDIGMLLRTSIVRIIIIGVFLKGFIAALKYYKLRKIIITLSKEDNV